MRSLSSYLFLAVIFLCSLRGASQDPNHYDLNELYGTDITSVYSLELDAQGKFWIGCEQGLVAFNGSTHKIHASNEYDQAASNIKPDALGRVWFSNFGGQLFYLYQDSVHVVIDQSLNGDFIKEYFFTGDDEVLYITYLGKSLVKYSISSNHHEILYSVRDGAHCFDLIEGDNHELSLLVLKHEIDSLVSRVIQLRLDPSNGTLTEQAQCQVPQISSKLDGFIWNQKLHVAIGGKDTLMIYELPTSSSKMGKPTRKIALSSKMLNLVQEFNDRLLLNTKAGAIMIDGPAAPFLARHNISMFKEDREGNLWVGTLNNGIQIIPNKDVRHVKVSDAEIITSTIDREGRIYFIDWEGGFYRVSAPDFQKEALGNGFQGSLTLKYDSINHEIFFSSDPRVYSVAENRMIVPRPADAYFIDALVVSEKVRLEVGPIGLVCRNFLGNPISPEEFPFKVRGVNIAAAHKDLLVTSLPRGERLQSELSGKGLYVDFTAGLTYYSKSEFPKPLSWNGKPILATAMATGDKETVWVVTEDHWLLKLKRGKVMFSHRLTHPVLHLAQWNNILFLAEMDRVLRIDLNTNSETYIDGTDGLMAEKIKQIFCSDNTLFILGKHYLQSVPCTYDYVNDIPPMLEISRVDLLGSSLPLAHHYSFANDENEVTFHFEVSAIRSRKSYNIKYRLLGASDQWFEASASNPFARFYPLSAGSYTLEVVASNEDGRASAPASISFTVDSHFTQKWWFYLLLVIVGAAAVVPLLRARNKRLAKEARHKTEQEELKKELYKSKISTIRSQMNPHFMFNALNSIQEFIITNQSDVAAEYLADFADLMRMYLEQSKKDDILLSDELAAMNVYLRLENIRFDQQLNYQLNCQDVIPEEVEVPVMLLQPFVENAIKHGLLHKEGEKLLRLDIRRTESGQLLISIQDNGIGRAASAKLNAHRKRHESFASSAIEQRINLLNQNSDLTIEINYTDLKDGAGQAAGTRVDILLMV